MSTLVDHKGNPIQRTRLPVPGTQEMIPGIINDYTDMIRSVLEYAQGGNPEGRNFFEEMDADPEFTKSYDQFQKRWEGLGDQAEALQAQLLLMMLEEERVFESVDGYKFISEKGKLTERLMIEAGQSEGPLLIKNLRRLQLADFGTPPTKENPIGFHFVCTNPEKEISDKEKSEMQRWQEVLATQFFYVQGDSDANFGSFLGAAYENFFDLDKVCIEIYRDNGGDPLAITLIDPTRVRLIVPEQNGNGQGMSRKRWDLKEYQELLDQANIPSPFKDEFRYLVMLPDMRRRAKFTNKFVRVFQFFQSSYTDRYGHFEGIVGQAARVISAIINAVTMNSARISDTGIPPSMITLTGGGTLIQNKFGRAELTLFKKLLWAHLRGARNRWRVPVISLPEKCDAKLLQFTQTSKDMEFFNWMSLMFTILCRLSGTDPEELSLASNRAVMSGKRLFEEGPEGIVKVSKDTGLKTFLAYMAQSLNTTDVIQELTGHDDWALMFTGLEAKDEAKKFDLLMKQLQTVKSINDLRREEGEEEMKFMVGGQNIYDLAGAANATFVSLIQSGLQGGMQESGGLPWEEEPGNGERGAPDKLREEMKETPKRVAPASKKKPEEEVKKSMIEIEVTV